MNANGYPITKEKITIKAMGLKNPGAVDWSELEILRGPKSLLIYI